LAALSVRGVGKRYGTTDALTDVDLTMEEGELVGLLGPNGAGKSTLTKIACGLVRPSTGEAAICGHRPGTTEANSSIGYLAELFRFPGWLSADEVLLLHQRLTGSEGGEGERAALLDAVGLGRESGRRVESMSKGMQQRLGIAQALVGSPRVLLLDEPTSALDPGGRRTIRELLAGLQAQGVAVLLSSHLLGEVELVSDRVAILFGGRVVAEGTPTELTEGAGVQVETAAGVRDMPGVERDEIPRIVAGLVANGEEVYAVRPRQSTLEDFYIETVAAEDPG
jgi:ABC-2 type transport system ATP-binding protein